MLAALLCQPAPAPPPPVVVPPAPQVMQLIVWAQPTEVPAWWSERQRKRRAEAEAARLAEEDWDVGLW